MKVSISSFFLHKPHMQHPPSYGPTYHSLCIYYMCNSVTNKEQREWNLFTSFFWSTSFFFELLNLSMTKFSTLVLEL